MPHYKGKNFPFTISGVSVGDVGVSKAEASGYHLTKLEDFNGKFTAGAAGATLGGGGSAAAMQNQSGVKLNLVRYDSRPEAQAGGGRREDPAQTVDRPAA